MIFILWFRVERRFGMGFLDNLKEVAGYAYEAAEKKALEVEKEKIRLERYSTKELKQMRRGTATSSRNLAIAQILKERGE